MEQNAAPDWEVIRARAKRFPEEAFQFVREGLSHTAKQVHGPKGPSAAATTAAEESRHISGRQLCLGLRDLALEKYGLLARAVLRKWGFTQTEDFGVIVYAMIDRGELRSSSEDRLEHFRDVFDFDDAFQSPLLN